MYIELIQLGALFDVEEVRILNIASTTMITGSCNRNEVNFVPYSIFFYIFDITLAMFIVAEGAQCICLLQASCAKYVSHYFEREKFQ